MKLFAVVLAIFLLIISSLGSEEIKENKPVDWKPLIGFKFPGGKVFYDKNNLQPNKSETKNLMGYGVILVTFDDSMLTELNGKRFMAASMMKYVVADCKSGMVVSIVNLYFNVPSPTAEDKPIAKYEYTSVKEGMKILPKSSPLYLTLCPFYI
jgi:hypothetical protein